MSARSAIFRIPIWIVALALLKCTSVGQLAEWQLSLGTLGNKIVAIDIYHNFPDSVYALGDSLILTTNSGDSWDGLSGSELGTDIGELKVDPTNSQLLYLS